MGVGRWEERDNETSNGDGRLTARRRCRSTYAADGDSVTLLHDVTGLIVLSGNKKTESNMNVIDHRWKIVKCKVQKYLD